METVLDIARNSVLVFAGVVIAAGILTYAGHALASDAVEDEPPEH